MTRPRVAVACAAVLVIAAATPALGHQPSSTAQGPNTTTDP
jgi:hypothetical protein